MADEKKEVSSNVTDEKKEKKTIVRRPLSERLEEAKQKVLDLEEQMRIEAQTAEEKERVKLAKRPLINAVNRIKTIEEVEQWKKALEGLVDFRD